MTFILLCKVEKSRSSCALSKETVLKQARELIIVGTGVPRNLSKV